MPDTLAQPLSEFLDDLARIEKLLRLIEQLREFGSRNITDQQSEDELIQASISLRASVRSQSAEFPILSGTLLLFVAGRFEHFVRISFEALCDAYAAKCSRFEQLPEKMRASLVTLTAEVLGKPSKFGFDEVRVQVIIHNLSANLKAEQGIGDINSACLSITEQNMQPGMLSELYKRIGITSLWVEISKQARMKMHFELDKDQEVERSARASLENLKCLREIALLIQLPVLHFRMYSGLRVVSNFSEF